MRARFLRILFVCSLLCGLVSFPFSLAVEGQKRGSSAPYVQGPTLAHAAMCEGVKDHTPQNEAIVFSVILGKVFCFTDFDPVPKSTFVYHKWFQRDTLVVKVRLSLQPPRWSTFSRILLQESSKGPWKVEITDQEDRPLRTLRFSVTD